MNFTIDVRLLLYPGCRFAYIIIAMHIFPCSLSVRLCVVVTVTTSDIEFLVVREYIDRPKTNTQKTVRRQTASAAKTFQTFAVPSRFLVQMILLAEFEE